MPKVFLVQETVHDVSKARAFGEIAPALCKKDYSGSATLYAAVQGALTEFDSDRDFLLPIGDPINIGIAFIALLKLGHVHVKVLRWNRHQARYRVVVVTLATIPLRSPFDGPNP